MDWLPDGFNPQCPVCSYLYNYYTEYSPPTYTLSSTNPSATESGYRNTRLVDHLNRVGTADDNHTPYDSSIDTAYRDSIKFAYNLYRNNPNSAYNRDTPSDSPNDNYTTDN